MQREIWKVPEVIKYTKLGKRTILKLFQEGTIPGRKIGGEWYSSKELITEWFNKYLIEEN